MSSRFGFSTLELPKAVEALKLAISGLEEKDATEANEFLAQADKLIGFKVPKKPSRPGIPDIDGIVWLRLDFVMSSRGLRLRYTQKNSNFEVPSDHTKLKNVLKESEKKDRKGRIPTEGIARPRYKGETPLSIDGDQKKALLVILNLPKGGGFQFNRDGAAISCASKDLPFFIEAGILTAGGSIKNYEDVLELKDESEDEKNDKCRTAYFIVDASKMASGSNVETIPRPFNIHLDIKGEKKKGYGEYYIPIIIDPDVRHPGGFGGGGFV